MYRGVPCPRCGPVTRAEVTRPTTADIRHLLYYDTSTWRRDRPCWSVVTAHTIYNLAEPGDIERIRCQTCGADLIDHFHWTRTNDGFLIRAHNMDLEEVL